MGDSRANCDITFEIYGKKYHQNLMADDFDIHPCIPQCRDYGCQLAGRRDKEDADCLYGTKSGTVEVLVEQPLIFRDLSEHPSWAVHRD
jgi:hypothetical protein